ncbi:MAG: beta-ketoacyl-[acyl-carrier-protein] synthase family protein [Candidatus Binatia bacterium]
MSNTTVRRVVGGAELYKSDNARSSRRQSRVLITGMGCVTPYGAGVDAFWRSLVRGESGIGPLTAFDPEPYGTRIAGQIPDFRPQDFMPQKDITGSARCMQLGVAAARLAIDDARLPLAGTDTSRVGVFFGTSVGTFSYAAENHAVFLEKGIRRVHPLFPAQSYPGVVATQIAIRFEVRGPAICVSTACTSATDAFGMAWLHIRAGLIDRAIVGGTDAPLTPLLFAAFDRLGVMSRHNESPAQASRPFASSRDGFVMSEGAGACVLESEESATDRDAPVRGELAGYAATSDAFHTFAPLPSGEEGVRAIRLALDAAEISADEVDYVNAHAIGSRPNDAIELDITRTVFGEITPRVPMSSIKSMIGHSMGAAGALELIACVKAIESSTLPPTVNLEPADLTQGFDLVPNQARETRVRVVLSPTFGFGSRNGVLVLRRA